MTGISPDIASVAEGGTPAGAEEWENDYGDVGYGHVGRRRARATGTLTGKFAR